MKIANRETILKLKASLLYGINYPEPGNTPSDEIILSLFTDGVIISDAFHTSYEYQKEWDLYNKNLVKFKKSLSESQVNGFDIVECCFYSVMGAAECETFVRAFKLGARIMLDMLDDESGLAYLNCRPEANTDVIKKVEFKSIPVNDTNKDSPFSDVLKREKAKMAPGGFNAKEELVRRIFGNTYELVDNDIRKKPKKSSAKKSAGDTEKGAEKGAAKTADAKAVDKDIEAASDKTPSKNPFTSAEAEENKSAETKAAEPAGIKTDKGDKK